MSGCWEIEASVSPARVLTDGSEQRRQLAVDVGELSQQLTDALTSIGCTAEQARSANVHQLATGTWQPPEDGKQSER